MSESIQSAQESPHVGSAREVFGEFLRLGLTSFGGPVAHLGYFRDRFVQRRRWFDDEAYADLIALCQFLPGPASSQVGMAIGLHRAGIRGLIAAWVGFTLPSAIVLTVLALGLASFGDAVSEGLLAGLKAAAVAVVAGAVMGMAKTLAPDAKRATIAVVAMILVLLIPSPVIQIIAIAIGGFLGAVWVRGGRTGKSQSDTETLERPETTIRGLSVPVTRRTGVISLVLCGILLIGLPIAVAGSGDPTLRLIDVFYRSGALVFGGGHVVLPLLEAETVRTGLVGHDAFLAGYGAAQAVPGPLFTFAAFLGASTTSGPTGILGAAIALTAIFLPAALLTIGVLPFWESLRQRVLVRRVLVGVSAAVVGLLAAALYDPVFVQGVTSPMSLAIAAAVFLAQTEWKIPAWAAVIAAGALGLLLL
ncbi:chromate efflux transporter [Brevibacterium sp. ZH18]|uniref:chromate efflux transporter n=1 Tax=Brevibacterium sp. ZH18 TaxID=2927784 RepID=UPI001F616D3A|nr:chromate efflux transporter [Brevibacterium sp. ZH18]MCI4010335.1 chromate efflux transporter [Brevibacterium sp. ZH18]